MKRLTTLLLAALLSFNVVLAPMVMAGNVPISGLPTNTSPDGSDEVPVNHAGTTKKVTLDQIVTYSGFPTHAANSTIHRSINDSGTATTDLWSASKINTSLGTKADKVGSAVNGHFAGLNGSGNLTDSGYSSSSFAAVSHNHNASDINAGTLPVTRGGTGQSNTFTDGQLLIGRTSGGDLVPATLTAGSGISVTNAAGSITITNTISYSFPTGYHGSAPPIYASSTTFTQAYIRERDSGDTFNIAKSGSTTVDTTTTGLNGIAQSANLTGTVSVTSGSATTTFSSTQAGVLQVGDVVCTAGGQCRRLASGSGTSWTAESNWTSTETTVTVKRGGRAPNTHYFKYDITQAAGANPNTILSTRNVAGGDSLVDLPAGYTLSRQEAFAIRLDGSSNIIPFMVSAGWPTRPRIQYDVTHQIQGATAGPTNVLRAGTSGTYVDVSLASYVPPISRYASLFISSGTSATASTGGYIRAKGASHNGAGYMVTGGSYSTGGVLSIPTDSSQIIQYANSVANSGNLDMNVFDYVVTEVP
jgi:hypothetical protein